MQVQDLIGLHNAVSAAVFIADQKIDCAEGFNGRSAHGGNPIRQPRQPLRRQFVVRTGGLCGLSCNLGVRLPVLVATVVVGDFVSVCSPGK